MLCVSLNKREEKLKEVVAFAEILAPIVQHCLLVFRRLLEKECVA